MMAENIVMTAGCAAFSRGPNGRITAWNEEAENLLDRPATFAVDRKCYRVLAGRDQIGCYCSERCPTWRLAMKDLTIPPYILDVKASQGQRIAVEFTILVADEDDGMHLIHLLNPLNKADLPFPSYEDWDEVDGRSSPYNFGRLDLTPCELDVIHHLSIGQDCGEIARQITKTQDEIWAEISNLVEKLRWRDYKD